MWYVCLKSLSKAVYLHYSSVYVVLYSHVCHDLLSHSSCELRCQCFLLLIIFTASIFGLNVIQGKGVSILSTFIIFSVTGSRRLLVYLRLLWVKVILVFCQYQWTFSWKQLLLLGIAFCAAGPVECFSTSWHTGICGSLCFLFVSWIRYLLVCSCMMQHFP